MGSLPPELQWTQDNLLFRAYSPSLTSFVMLHTFWHQGHCDLFRPSIRGIQESVPDDALDDAPSDYLTHLRQKSLKSALKLAEIWSEVVNLGVETPIKDSSIAACAYQCAKIVTSLNGTVSIGADLPDMSPVKAVEACLNILEDLRNIYPVVDIIVCESVPQLVPEY